MNNFSLEAIPFERAFGSSSSQRAKKRLLVLCRGVIFDWSWRFPRLGSGLPVFIQCIQSFLYHDGTRLKSLSGVFQLHLWKGKKERKKDKGHLDDCI